MKDKKEKISRMILSYLRRNPDAGDTLEGISKWWLEMERIELTVDEIAEVLEILVKDEVIAVNKLASGTIFYKIKDEEI